MLIAARVAAVVLLFVLIAILQLLLTALGRRDLIPPPFLAAVGWLCGLRVRVVGRPAPGKLLLIANHLSWLDILALAGCCSAAFVGKSELAGHPFLKWLCEQNDTLFITRERRGTVSDQVSSLSDALSRRRMTLFPEGTTGDGSGLLPFKSALLSAAQSAGPDVTVQPVALDYAEAEAIAWGDDPGMANIWTILSRTRPVHLTVHFLDPLPPAITGDRKAMSAASHAAIAQALHL